MSTATIIQKNYVNMLPNNKVMLKNKTKFVLVKAAFPALRVSMYSTSVRWLHQNKKLEFFLNYYYIILHFVHLSFFKIISLHVLYFFLVNKTEPKLKCIFNDLCIKKFSR